MMIYAKNEHTASLNLLPRFPVAPEKSPLTRRGYLDATINPIGECLWPLVGVPTGARSGFDVLDIDVAGLAWLDRKADRLPPARMHETRSGGRHLIFQHWPGLRCSASKLAPGVDVRADGGYVIWWPARGYPVLSDAPIAARPEWLVRELSTPTVQRLAMGVFPLISPEETPILALPTVRERRYALAALRNAMQEMIDAKQGERNRKLNALAYKLGRLSARGWIDPARVVRGLELGAWSCGLQTDDGLAQVRATIASGLTAGMAMLYPDMPEWGSQ